MLKVFGEHLKELELEEGNQILVSFEKL